ncbi:hypothetical protein BD410DRAFT_549675 [Rickenella mellea]|uniref:F-box domain-containing protein n=1 Tax=Rickenella mellea TaxID=50990 RepID=A0A4Y7PPY6_9AGAM|nr:hypothetical protein BD410DRAFT_549675 [Rickenella mellea]
MPSMNITIEERTIDQLISALSRMKGKGGVVGNLSVLFLQSGEALRGDDFATYLVALRCLKSSRDALRVMLHATNDEIHVLQEKCLPFTRQRGIQSLPDDILKNVFEIGYETYDNVYWDHTFPVEVSHVNQRFRSTALCTPRIWTNLTNRMPVAQLETFISRSKATELSIFLDLWESWKDKSGNTETFFEIAKKHSDRWSSFTYQCDMPEDDDDAPNGYIHPSLSQCRHLTLPWLRTLSCKIDCNDEDDRVPNPEAIFATWNMPELNVTCCNLVFEADSDGLWDFRKLFLVLESWSHLNSLSFQISCFQYTLLVFQSSLQNLTSFNMDVGLEVDMAFITKFFSLVEMPALSSIAIAFRDERGTNVGHIIDTICTTACRYSTLEKFTLDTTRTHCAHHDILYTVASHFPFLQEVSFRGT